MSQALYPLRFEPIYQYRLWGGRRLGELLRAPLPRDGPIGEAWMLSDRDEQPSRVADGPLKGSTLAQLMAWFPHQMLGTLAPRFRRFPLLLKFLDVRRMLSVQVHPSDDMASLLPKGESGKTEAWVVLQAEPESRIYAGLKAGVDVHDLRALSNRSVDDCLPSFTPKPGDAIFIEAGTVHSLGDGVLVFEVQENSDVTFRLFDWEHVDPMTGHVRPLQLEQALACVDFAQGPIGPVKPTNVTQETLTRRDLLIACRHFQLWHIHGEAPITVGAQGRARVAVCINGNGWLHYDGVQYALGKGEVMFLPAAVGACQFEPDGVADVLEIAMPAEA
jgi:mannose-6-phosphate isomerase